eukprot:TRINITY_DN30185_c0_g1_i1.p1 TRINITY_DN30185_c0_g1~~TRINITY_DN30185_c0_g1_i1.p1  ORF type:complete len:569 (-),score=129.88 TRINITY_DN30185_c0_g1_i1:57-1763(-)
MAPQRGAGDGGAFLAARCCADDASKGRSLVATRALAPGDVALVSHAWISCLCPSQAENCCARCLRRLPLQPCSRGCGFGYCSKSCREADAEDHNLECGAIALLEDSLRKAGDHVWHNGDAVLNALLLARAARRLDQRGDTRASATARAAAAGVGEETPTAARLATPFKGKPNALRALLSTPRLAIPIAIATATLDAAAAKPGLLPRSRLGREADVERLVGLLLQQQVNACGVVDPSRFEVTGEGLFVEGALVNHSCEPNCQFIYRWDSDGALPTQYLMALVSIARGEELTISYGDTARPVWERRGRLQRSHWFTCRCTRCESEVKPEGLRAQAQLVADVQGRPLQALIEGTASDAEEAAAVVRGFSALGVAFGLEADSRRISAARSRASGGPGAGSVNAFRLESSTRAAADEYAAALRQTRASLREVVPLVHRDALVVGDLQTLALAQAEAAGDSGAMLELTESLLSACGRHYGDLHPRRCALLTLRQAALAALGRRDDAAKALRELLELRRRLLLQDASTGATPPVAPSVPTRAGYPAASVTRDGAAAEATSSPPPPQTTCALDGMD